MKKSNIRKKVRAGILAAALVFLCACGDDEIGSVGNHSNGNNAGGVTSQSQTPTTQAGTPTTQAQTPTTQADTPTTQAQTPTTQADTPTTQSQTQTGAIATKQISNEYYSVTVPDGWTWTEWGYGIGFGFMCVNPNNPDMLIMYAGKVEPIFLTQESRDAYYRYGEAGAYFYDAPLLPEKSAAGTLAAWDQFVNYQIKYEGKNTFPAISNINVYDAQVTNDRTAPYQPSFVDSAAAATAIGENGTNVQVLLANSVGGEEMDIMGLGYDNTTKVIYLTYYVQCPEDQAQACMQTMTQCVFSIEFTEKAVEDTTPAPYTPDSSMNLSGPTIPDGSEIPAQAYETDDGVNPPSAPVTPPELPLQ